MSPQTVADWHAELAGMQILKALMPKAWALTVLTFEVGNRAALASWDGAR